MSTEMVTVAAATLHPLVAQAFESVGVRAADARTVADVLVFADLRGTHSHGVMRVEHYTNRIRQGGMNLTPSLDVTRLKSVAARINGDGGLGHVAARKATEEAIARAQEHGIGMVGVFNSSHCGALAFYVTMALEKGLASLVVVNTDSIVVPFGAKQPFFGTNPFAFGFPGKDESMLLDMATSEVALGKIFYAREQNLPIPEGWAVDRDGNPTTDASKAAYLFPFGGPKGYGINMLVEMLSGVLVGGVYGPQVVSMYGDLKTQRNLSSFHMVFDPTIFTGESVYQTAQSMFDDLHALTPADGVDRVLLPGEIEASTMARSRETGIEIPRHTFEFLGGTT